jgi:hypothetical protein
MTPPRPHIYVCAPDVGVLLTAPHHPDLAEAARNLGGIFLGNKTLMGTAYERWQFDAGDERLIRDFARRIWGPVDTDPGTVTVLYMIPHEANTRQDLWRFGRRLAYRPDHDHTVQFDEGVTVYAGRFPWRGGSRSRPALDAERFTVLEVRDVRFETPQLWCDDPNTTVLGFSCDTDQSTLSSGGPAGGLSLDYPEGLGAYLRKVRAAASVESPSRQLRNVDTAVAVALFRAGAESSGGWAGGWDACLDACASALAELRAHRANTT